MFAHTVVPLLERVHNDTDNHHQQQSNSNQTVEQRTPYKCSASTALTSYFNGVNTGTFVALLRHLAIVADAHIGIGAISVNALALADGKTKQYCTVNSILAQPIACFTLTFAINAASIETLLSAVVFLNSGKL